MKRRALLALVIAPFSSRGQSGRKPANAARIEVLSVKSERAGGRITLDGAIRNTGARPLAKLVLVFDLQDADQKPISRRRGPIEEAVLDPGGESSFGFFVPDHARAVSVKVGAEHRGMEMEVVKPGPYYIE